MDWAKLTDSAARFSRRKSIFDAEQTRLAAILRDPNHPLRQEIVDSGLPQFFALLDPTGDSEKLARQGRSRAHRSFGTVECAQITRSINEPFTLVRPPT